MEAWPLQSHARVTTLGSGARPVASLRVTDYCEPGARHGLHGLRDGFRLLGLTAREESRSHALLVNVG